ncbi:11761_t:CDS:2, partial [Cetraspora pellucida]
RKQYKTLRRTSEDEAGQNSSTSILTLMERVSRLRKKTEKMMRSMSPYIKAAKEHILKVASYVNSNNSNIKLWLVSVAIKTGKILCHIPPKTLAEVKDEYYFINSNFIEQDISFKLAPQPFSVIAERYAYFALNTSLG